MTDCALNLPAAFADALAGVERPGGFHAAGTFDIHPPRLVVEGVGAIALPLLPVQAEALIAVAEAAPYGRGTETLHDPAVRRTWQIDATRVSLTGARWGADLAAVVERVRAALAVPGEVSAELYKLLIYDAGAFFAPHRDTEKAPGMFGTLVIVLPGEFTGGALLIRHRGETAAVDLCCDEPSSATFAAFYADCVHEVQPVTSGHRLALIYNLVRQGPGPLPVAPDYRGPQDRLTRLLADWGAPATPPPPGPNKLVYPLEHAYTPAELAFATLKGQDAAVAGLLLAAAPAADCELYLGLLSVSESGWAEYGGRWNAPEFEIGEVTETMRGLHDWQRPDGSVPDLEPLPFTDDELAPPDALADLDDTEPEFSEATGNEGASFERLYQRAALVLWPRRRRPLVLAAAGTQVSLPALGALVQQWETGGRADDDCRQQALALADAIAAGWPTRHWVRRDASQNGDASALCAAWLTLGAIEPCAAFIGGPVADGGYTSKDETVTARLLEVLPAAGAATLLRAIISGNGASRPGACAGLLARLHADAMAPGILAPAATALLTALMDQPPTPPADWRDRPEPLNSAYCGSMLRAFAGIDETLAEQFVDHCLARPGDYDPDALLIPALLSLGPAPAAPAIARLREALIAHLDRRIGEALAPPADWTRAAALTCRCADCQAVNAFLASPSAPVWRLRAVEAARAQVSDSIQRAKADLDLATDKRGRPYTLICTKNQASYERLAARRQRDLEHRERLLADG